MNPRIDFPNPLEPTTLDRLVDGELSAAEEQALLTSFDAQPEGWRRCALAFLEARTWKNELTAVAGQRVARCTSSALNGAPQIVSPQTPRRAVAHRARILAIAASIGLAFFLGIVVRGQWIRSGNAGNQIAHGRPAIGSDEANLDDAQTHRVAKPSITMAVVDNQGDVKRQFELPVVEPDRLGTGWLARPPAAVSPQEIEALQAYGYQVDQERLYVPVYLDDGRQAIVSFDRAAVKYSGLQF